MVYLLAVLYLLIILGLFFFTRKKYTGQFHIGLLISIVPFVIRPILSQSNDGWLLYSSKYQTANDYLNIYFVVILFKLFYFFGYLARMIFFESRKTAPMINIKMGYIAKPQIGLLIMVIMFGYLFATAGLSWLGTFRDSVASNVVPAFRIIYPVTIFICYFLAISTYFRVQKQKSKKKLYVMIFVIFIFITLLNTRGWFISIVALLFCFHFSKHRLSMKAIALMGGILMFVAFYMRSIVGWIFGNEIAENDTLYNLLLNKFLFTSSGDIVDVWHIVYDYVQDNGFQYGSTILGNFMLLFPSGIREFVEIKPAADLVNFYYAGDIYYEKNFGFNINISQELFINFGYVAFVPIFFTGYLYRYFEAKIFLVEEVNTVTILKICFYIQILGLLVALPVMSWLIFFYVLYKFVQYTRKILPKKNEKNSLSF